MMFEQTSNEYVANLEAFSRALIACSTLSDDCAGIPAPTMRHTYAAVLFTAMCTRAMNLGIMAPRNRWTVKQIDLWDYAGMFSLTRNILEIRLAFHYICVDNCSKAEWGLRWNLFNLHDCCSRIKLFKVMDPVHPEIPFFEQQANDLRNRISVNRCFRENKLQISEKQQRVLLTGDKSYLYSLEEIANRAGISSDSFKLTWQLFSNKIHGYPMAFYRMLDGERGRGVHSIVEDGYSALALSCATELLTATHLEMSALFHKHKHR